MPEPSDDRLPDSPGATDAILGGEVVISETCPTCGAKFAYPTGNTFTCGDCYTEFGNA